MKNNKKKSIVYRTYMILLPFIKNPINTVTEYIYFRKIAKIIPNISHYGYHASLKNLKCFANKKGYKNLKEYSVFLQKDKAEQENLKTKITLNGTHFFRGNDWNTFIKKCLINYENKKIKIWCAGCSSGEEVYSVIMAILDYTSIDNISVLATDYNDLLLEKCLQGQYYNMHLPEIPQKYHKYLSVGKSKFIIDQKLRDVIKIKNLNLLTDNYPLDFDIIICRNVIKFFRPNSRELIEKKLVNSLKKGGVILLSENHNECISKYKKMHLKQVDNLHIYIK